MRPAARRPLICAVLSLLITAGMAGCLSGSKHFSGGQSASIFAGAIADKNGKPADGTHGPIMYGQALAMTTDRAGGVYLVTDGPSLWRITPAGQVSGGPLNLAPYDTDGDLFQMAVDTAGRVWLAYSDMLLRLDSGKITAVTVTRDAVKDDRYLPRSGIPMAQPDIFEIAGVAAAPNGTVDFAEMPAHPKDPARIFTVGHDGAIHPVLGKSATGTAPAEQQPCAQRRIPGAQDLYTQVACQLAFDPQGNLYLAGAGGVWKWRPGGPAPVAVATGSKVPTSTTAAAPFTPVGPAADLGFNVRGSNGDYAHIAVDGRGNLYVKTGMVSQTKPFPRPAFAWTITGNDPATAFLRKAQWTNPGDYDYNDQTYIAQLRPDATAALADIGGAMFATYGNWLYVTALQPEIDKYYGSGGTIILQIPIP